MDFGTDKIHRADTWLGLMAQLRAIKCHWLVDHLSWRSLEKSCVLSNLRWALHSPGCLSAYEWALLIQQRERERDTCHLLDCHMSLLSCSPFGPPCSREAQGKLLWACYSLDRGVWRQCFSVSKKVPSNEGSTVTDWTSTFSYVLIQ